MEKPEIIDSRNNSEQVAAIIDKVIDVGERAFGATAWKGHKEEGRGVVLVTFVNIPTTSEEVVSQLHSATYRSLAAAKAQGLGSLWGFDDKSVEIIEAYDPKSEFVLSIFEPLEQHSTWRVKPTQPPPEAFRYLAPELFGIDTEPLNRSLERGPAESGDEYLGRLESIVAAGPPSHDDYAKTILSAYAQRHFGGTREAILDPLKDLFVRERRTLFQPHSLLAQVARALVCCPDDSEIREWGVDLLGRVGDLSDVEKIVELANNDDSPKVRQEATAALGKMLRFRGDIPREQVKAAIDFSREETDEKTLYARSLVVDILDVKSESAPAGDSSARRDLDI